MPVAKSYENMTIVGEPYSYDNDPKKLYVRVKGNCKRCGGSGHYSFNLRDGTMCLACRGSGKEILEVRWYTESQRAAMDRAAEKRNAAKAIKVEERRIKFAARNAFGFCEAGYITLFKGDSNIINDWAHETNPCRARFNLIFGWFCPSWLEYENLPEEITPIKLTWDEVRDENDEENLMMRPNEEVIRYVQSLLHETSKSTYQGKVGEWIERDITVVKNVETNSYYGASRFHIMEDADGNQYVWSTASKNLVEGYTCHLRMKVKEHKDYEGVPQTIVYYCKEK